MARGNKRIEFLENTNYHVFNRGLGKQIIFHNEYEYSRFYKLMIKYLELFKTIKIVSYCLLPNHFHLVVHNVEGGYDLSDFMKRVQGAYATWFRIKYPSEFKQPIFEGRFKAKLIEDEEYLNKCLSYVNFNAVKHNIVTDIKDYPYTSYHQLSHKEKITSYKDLILDELEF